MIIPFLYELRRQKVPVGTQEVLALAKALSQGLHNSSLDRFYYVARSLMVHQEGHLDAFDQAFASHFRGVEITRTQVRDQLLEWLSEAKNRLSALIDQVRTEAKERP